VSEVEHHTVPVDAPRLDQYLAGLLSGQSRNRVQRLIADGHVRVNDGAARAGLRLRKGDRLSWELPPTTPSRLQAEAMDLRVLYEDDDLVVIDKPAGLPVHAGPGGGPNLEANFEALRFGLPAPPALALMGGLGTVLFGAVGLARTLFVVAAIPLGVLGAYRLDRDTSGLIVVARNDATHRALTRQLQQRLMTRRYRAIAVGEVADPAARIEAPIGRDVKHRQRMVVVAGGREAITEFIRLGVAGGHSLLQVSLTTGRTHQIRVHLAFIKHPVLGDPVYGHRSPLIGRPALHAETLTLRHPRTGKSMTWQAAPPEDFELAWNSLSVRTMR